jgi:biopolymer transport protein ExbB
VSGRRGLLWSLLIALLTLGPRPARAWWNDEWAARKPLQLDTGPAGANLAQPLPPAPLLVRLHVGNFRFELAKEDGSDLRFVAGDDKTPLPFHLEKFDPLLGEALVWVALPELKPGAKVPLWIYFHNPKATPAEEAKGTFDQSTVLVWHFAEQGQPPRDSTTFANHALAAGTPAEGALIGRGLKLDGSGSLALPASPALAWGSGAKVSLSLWAKPALAEQNGVLFTRRDGATALRVALRAGRPVVELETPAGVLRASASAALAPGSWHHLGFSAGEAIILYVDGQEAGRFSGPLPELMSPAVLGRDPLADPDQKRGAEQLPPFRGELDELQLSSALRPAGWFQLAAATQGTDPSKTLQFGNDEESGGGTGYLTVILRSVTPDGWVVIALLGVMALVSFSVMIGKVRFLARVRAANGRFTARFRLADVSISRLLPEPGGPSPLGDEKPLREATLFQLARLCASEAHKRTARGRPLSAEAIASIRASLDAELVRQGQALNRQLVLLTIAISGGPFLGLLGTVVGVMITFAAIAAAGDVNVNAIAPGIAAALVATVAGLGVAIPSLFGYNWLLAQVKSIAASQQVFADELVTRLAEEHAEGLAHGSNGHGVTIESSEVVRRAHPSPPPAPADA